MRRFGFLLLTLFTSPVFASTALLDFSNSMYSFSADFTQTVYDSDSTVLQESKGQVKLVRPGKFRWTYNEPFKQIIVADGLTLWVYDEDIAQVTMQPQAQTLGSAPIGLLSGQRALESEFNIIDLGESDGMQWFQLEPLVQDTDFHKVFIAVDGNGLRAMELRDNFEQATQIRFANFKKNSSIAEDEFIFTPPEGVDVVGEVGTPPAMETQDSVVDPLLEEAEPETTIAEPAVAETPATAEDVLLDTGDDQLLETPDDAPGMADAVTETQSEDSEITFEVIETIKVPVE